MSSRVYPTALTHRKGSLSPKRDLQRHLHTTLRSWQCVLISFPAEKHELWPLFAPSPAERVCFIRQCLDSKCGHKKTSCRFAIRWRATERIPTSKRGCSCRNVCKMTHDGYWHDEGEVVGRYAHTDSIPWLCCSCLNV